MEIYFVRHTRVDVKPGTCYGITDVALQPSFEEEADFTSKNLQGLTFDKVYSSPLSRCQRLAEFLAPDDSIQLDDRLREMDFGDWEGLLWDDIYHTEEGKKWFEDYFHFHTPGGESFMQLIERAQIFLKDLQLKNKSVKRVLVVSHAGPIRAFNILLNHLDPAVAFNLAVDHGQVFCWTLP